MARTKGADGKRKESGNSSQQASKRRRTESNVLEVLFGNRFLEFNRFNQKYEKRYVVKGKFFNFRDLEAEFEVSRWLRQQGWESYVSYKDNMFPRLVRVMISNLNVKSGKSWVGNTEFDLSEESLRNSFNLSSEEEEIVWPSRQMIFSELAGKEINEKQNFLHVSFLDVNLRLAYLIVINNVYPRRGGTGDLSEKDAKIVWALKNGRRINLAKLMMEHIHLIKSTTRFPLPYGMALSKLIREFGISTESEEEEDFPKASDHLDREALKRLGFKRTEHGWIAGKTSKSKHVKQSNLERTAEEEQEAVEVPETVTQPEDHDSGTEAAREEEIPSRQEPMELDRQEEDQEEHLITETIEEVPRDIPSVVAEAENHSSPSVPVEEVATTTEVIQSTSLVSVTAEEDTEEIQSISLAPVEAEAATEEIQASPTPSPSPSTIRRSPQAFTPPPSPPPIQQPSSSHIPESSSIPNPIEVRLIIIEHYLSMLAVHMNAIDLRHHELLLSMIGTANVINGRLDSIDERLSHLEFIAESVRNPSQSHFTPPPFSFNSFFSTRPQPQPAQPSHTSPISVSSSPKSSSSPTPSTVNPTVDPPLTSHTPLLLTYSPQVSSPQIPSQPSPQITETVIPETTVEPSLSHSPPTTSQSSPRVSDTVIPETTVEPPLSQTTPAEPTPVIDNPIYLTHSELNLKLSINSEVISMFQTLNLPLLPDEVPFPELLDNTFMDRIVTLPDPPETPAHHKIQLPDKDAIIAEYTDRLLSMIPTATPVRTTLPPS